jgi:cytochrome P450
MSAGLQVSGEVIFDPLSEEYFTGAAKTYRRLRDEAPVSYNKKHNFYALSRYEDVRAAYRDWQTYTSSRGIMLDQMSIPEFDGQSIPGFLGLYDPPLHLRVRTLASSGLTPHKVGAMEEAIHTAVDAALDPLAASSHPDFMVDFASSFPAEVVYTLMGIPRSDWVKVHTLSQSFLSAGEPGEESLFNEERMGAMLELIGYFSELSAVKRESADDDIITRMVQTSYVDEQGVEQKLSDLEMGGYLLQLLAASVESTAKLMTGAFVLLHHHGLWQRVLDDPSLIPAALSEAGRLEPPVQFLGRKTTVDVTLHGVTIPAGSSVLLLIAAANRDERVYDDPDSFRIEREMRMQPMTFGMGPHACMGKHLGELEGRIALEEFGKRFPHAEIIEEGLERVRAIHVFGWKNVPLRLR